MSKAQDQVRSDKIKLRRWGLPNSGAIIPWLVPTLTRHMTSSVYTCFSWSGNITLMLHAHLYYRSPCYLLSNKILKQHTPHLGTHHLSSSVSRLSLSIDNVEYINVKADLTWKLKEGLGYVFYSWVFFWHIVPLLCYDLDIILICLWSGKLQYLISRYNWRVVGADINIPIPEQPRPSSLLLERWTW